MVRYVIRAFLILTRRLLRQLYSALKKKVKWLNEKLKLIWTDQILAHPRVDAPLSWLDAKYSRFFDKWLKVDWDQIEVKIIKILKKHPKHNFSLRYLDHINNWCIEKRFFNKTHKHKGGTINWTRNVLFWIFFAFSSHWARLKNVRRAIVWFRDKRIQVPILWTWCWCFVTGSTLIINYIFRIIHKITTKRNLKRKKK